MIYLVMLEKTSNFAATNLIIIAYVRKKKNNDPIKGEAAKEIRSQMMRLITGSLNEEDLKRRTFLKALRDNSKHSITWN